MQPPSKRRIAEVQYKLSLSLTFMEQPDQALAQTEEAIGSLEVRGWAAEGLWGAGHIWAVAGAGELGACGWLEGGRGVTRSRGAGHHAPFRQGLS